MTVYEDPDTYTWLCEQCIQMLKLVTSQFNAGVHLDTGDTEAPSMFMYKYGMFCGRHSCKESD